MKSKTSFYNGGIIRQNVKQHGWISLIYFTVLIFALPLQMIMIDTELHQHRFNHLDDFFSFAGPLQTLAVSIIPILTGIFIFRYLHVKVAADMAHSLPLRRGSLFTNHYLSGLFMLLIPVWTTAIITNLVRSIVSYGDQLTASDLITWAVTMTLFTIFFYSCSVLVGMMTGISVIQGILTYILLVLPLGLITLMSFHLRMFLNGFSERYTTSINVEKWSPLIHFAEISRNALSIFEVTMYFGGTLLLVIIAYILYKFRHIESASQAIAIQPLRPVFKYGVTFCFMLLSGAYFERGDGLSWLIFGYIIGSFIGYIIAEMILQKTWRIFQPKAFIGYIGFAAVTVLLIIAISMDITGYETRVPEASQVESVYFGQNIFNLRDELDKDSSDAFITDEDYIEKVIALHETASQQQSNEQESHQYGSNYFFIAYQLENGNRLVREYELSHELTKEQIAPVLESEQYKNSHFHLKQLERPTDTITIIANEPINKSIAIIDPDEMAELKQIVKGEYINMSYDEMMTSKRDWATIQLSFTDTDQDQLNMQRTAFPWKKSFSTLEQWLEENNYLDQARIHAHEVEYLEVVQIAENGDRHIHPTQVFNLPHEYHILSSTQIVDEQEIDAALQVYSDYTEGQYFLKFVTIDGTEFYGMFTSDSIPKEIYSQL
ncbi:hypothetical protein [Desertibacillus haloalkaliphilus]|uniref:hypothetical protein n=1 Tax=Desertibacillus haloalkaliphilus TaxID=1328930 RepID=UPI001C27A55E|nr:hypothetical protein [Desertibacillus haloalkaliphilus]MBU8908845.1 hypothetical protein [Desertibacillus haloalkaliphilus]